MFTWWFAGIHNAYALSIDTLIYRLNTQIIDPIIVFMMALALLVFIWGAVEFLMNQGGGEEKAIASGKQHLLWGLIGLVIMVSVFGIMRLIVNTFGITGPPGTNITFPH